VTSGRKKWPKPVTFFVPGVAPLAVKFVCDTVGPCRDIRAVGHQVQRCRQRPGPMHR
jgi:hypothetical protein